MIYYEKKINDPSFDWMLLLHGIGGSIQAWKYQREDFSKEYNLLLVDLDGHGKSDFNEEKTKYKPTQMANSINEILIKENIERLHVVSFSLGTEVALEFVRLYPDKIKKLILSGCIVNLDFKKKLLAAIVLINSKILPLKLSYSISAKILLPKKNHAKSRHFFIREALKMKKIAFTKWLVRLGATKKLLREYVEVLNTHPIPTYFIMGNEDYMFFKGTKKLKEQIHNARMYVFEHCGHGCCIEKKELYNKKVMQILGEE